MRSDILDAAGSIQLCTGQTAVTEAGVHAMNQAFQANEAENVLLVDGETFRKYLVHGPRINLYINIYRQRGQFVQLGDSLSSKNTCDCAWVCMCARVSECSGVCVCLGACVCVRACSCARLRRCVRVCESS